MNRCTFKILTKKKEGQSHRETEVTIDWRGISEDDLKILAKSAIVRDLQAKIQAGVFDTFPDKVEVVAKDLIRHDPAGQWEYQPNAVRSANHSTISTIDKKLEKLLQELSPEELKALLA